ncbi:gluconolactonase [Aspergillus udagawae]|uniref:Gluconolactonase n=1 Tax=Aspergillus udagawae TaxID=91492 RepID=A0A8H3NJR7_9EURO|nr:gluconolactonase [Aspergillus udagawae]
MLKTEVMQNNFYGHRFNSMNDIVVSGEDIAFFTDGYQGWDDFNDTLFPQLANGVYPWDMSTGNIKMVAGAADGAFFNPNGLAFNHDQTRSDVTNRGFSSSDLHGARTIYVYNVIPSGISNREIFAYVDSGFPDGMETDRQGWSGDQCMFMTIVAHFLVDFDDVEETLFANMVDMCSLRILTGWA